MAGRAYERVILRRHEACAAMPAGERAASAYAATELAGATPQRLRILLFDGAIGLCREARRALDEGNAELAASRLARALLTVRQLQDCVRSAPQCPSRRRFVELYEQVHRGLIEADFYRRRESVSETISLLSRERLDWRRFAEAGDPAQASPPAISARCWVG